ncbi:MAG: twin-arginine translocase subunit TatC [Anaerohalosphaeraceae bacterium]
MEQEEELKSMSLGDHLEELRARLILAILGLAVGLGIALFWGRDFLHLILFPFEQAMKQSNQEPLLQAIKVAEPFLIYLKASLVLGILLSSPWVFYQIWAFVSAGLYRRERRYVYVVAPISVLLFISGVLFFLLIVAPIALKFFVQFNAGVEYIRYQPSLSDYVSFVLMLSVIFGLTFQTPIFIVFAERMGLIRLESLRKIRRYVFLASFIIGAFATPPDVITQIALAVPLYLLYEASLLVCRFWRRKE